MNGSKHKHHRLKDAARDHAHRPAWKSLHRDWRIWVVVLLMLAAMTFFVMRRSLARRFFIQPQEELSRRFDYGT